MLAFAMLQLQSMSPPAAAVVDYGAVGGKPEIPSTIIDVAGVADESAASRVWTLLLVIPSACVCLQLVCWGTYSLHGAHLKQVRNAAAQYDHSTMLTDIL